MNIFYIANSLFLPQLAASICSLCENNRNIDEIHFFIGSVDFSLQDEEGLRLLISRYGRNIHYIKISDIRERVGFSFDTGGWNEIVLARLFVGELLPADVDQVLYLDADTIVLKDLGGLWNTDMEDNVLGASQEPTVNRKRKEDLGILNGTYFNAGVLLVDLKKWRKQNITAQILDYYKKRKGILTANDQDAINAVLCSRIKNISPAYNFSNIFWHYPYRILAKLQYPAEYISKTEFDSAVSDPAVIHFLGEERPWRKGNRHKYAADYEKFLAMTPWQDTSQEDGWKLYFRCYYTFWEVLKPFPMLQYKIMDMLIPLVLKIRAGRKKK